MKIDNALTISLIAVCSLAGCENSKPQASDVSASVGSLVESRADTSAFYSNTSCENIAAPKHVKAGQIFEWKSSSDDKNIPSMTRVQSVRTVVGDMARYDEVFVMGGNYSPPELREVRLGFLLTSSTGRSMRYEGAEAAINGLQPGQKIQVPITETLSAASKSAQGEALIHYVGCGVTRPIVTGAPNEPVKIYQLTMPHSSPEAPGQMTEQTELEILISPRLGWPVVESVSSSTMVLTSVSD